jgi:hypothetical protein
MAPASFDIQAASLNSIDSPALSQFLGKPQLSTSFYPAPRDVACLGAAINTVNENGEANTTTLETSIYTLTAINNGTDGPNGRGGLEATLSPGSLCVTQAAPMSARFRPVGAPAIKASGACVGNRLKPVEG